jgi:hypothetical protein
MAGQVVSGGRSIGIPPRIICILALIIGIVNQYWLSGEKLDYRRVWKEFSNALLEGIQKGGERP